MTIDAAVAFVLGVLFALGLGVSGMTDPMKVQAFLDVTGDWDPSLVLVMGSAVVSTWILFRVAARRKAPVFTKDFELPKVSRIDAPLVLGSALFGAGWGIGGYCPGPALASLVCGGWRTAVFVGAMMLGLVIGDLVRVRFDAFVRHRE